MKHWIEETDEETLRTWVKNCPAMKLASLPTGEILWANGAFLEWSQYTLGELLKSTWMSISVPDKNLDADVDELKLLDKYNLSYTVKKQYIPKGSKPEWGTLTVMRYPAEGPIKVCLCTWEPLKNGTATAFALAMDQNKLIENRLTEMTAELAKITGQTDEDRFVLGSIRMVQRHPKLAAAFLVIAMSIFGLNNVVELLQRTGLIQIPVKPVPASASVDHVYADAIVSKISHDGITTKAGNTITFGVHNAGRLPEQSMSLGNGRTRRGISTVRRSADCDPRSNDGVHDMSGRAFKSDSWAGTNKPANSDGVRF